MKTEVIDWQAPYYIYLDCLNTSLTEALAKVAEVKSALDKLECIDKKTTWPTWTNTDENKVTELELAIDKLKYTDKTTTWKTWITTDENNS